MQFPLSGSTSITLQSRHNIKRKVAIGRLWQIPGTAIGFVTGDFTLSSRAGFMFQSLTLKEALIPKTLQDVPKLDLYVGDKKLLSGTVVNGDLLFHAASGPEWLFRAGADSFIDPYKLPNTGVVYFDVTLGERDPLKFPVAQWNMEDKTVAVAKISNPVANRE